jgi:uncharacterized protein
MKLIRASDYITRPWKNGGGTTREVVIFPAGATYDNFGWTVSAARVDREGPFSVFPCADRTMAILSGTSLALHGLAATPAILTANSDPFSFPGDVAVNATLGGEPIENMNMMVRRDQFGHRMLRVTGTDPISLVPRGTSIIFVQSGTADVSAVDQAATRLATEDSLISDAPVMVTPHGVVTVLLMDVWPL